MSEVFAWRDAPRADFAVIGSPVDHSKSPAMHTAAYEGLNLPYRYVAIHVEEGEFNVAMDHLGVLGYIGVNVTVPHKHAALAWSRNPDELARTVGAANTLKLSGEATNTDVTGFADTIANFRIERALVLGAGGSARAVSLALKQSGATVEIWNRTAIAAQELADEFEIVSVQYADTKGYELVVNATSASLKNESLPIRWSNGAGCVAYDLVYGDTPFLSEARDRGFQTIDGSELLVAQGARAFTWWTGLEAPVEAMRSAL